MTASLSSLTAKDGLGTPRLVSVADKSGNGSGPFVPLHVPSDVEGAPLFSVANPGRVVIDTTGLATDAALGTDGTSPPTLPGGATGIRGWLRYLASLLPGSVGAKTSSASLAVTLASNEPLVAAAGAPGDAAWDGSAGSASQTSILKALWIRLSAIATAATAATPAGENHVGEVGGNAGICTASPTVTASSAYAAGNVIGGKLTLSSLARVAAGSGLIQSLSLYSKASQTSPAIDVLIFRADPTASTLTDKQALAIASADFDKVVAVVSLTTWTSLGTPSMMQALSIGAAFKLPAGVTDAYAVLVARSAITFGSTSDLALAVRALRD